MDNSIADIPEHLLLPIGMATGAAVLILLAYHLLRARRGRRVAKQGRHSQRIDLASFENTGVPANGPCLELYNVPVRLVLVVVAPAGRNGKLPHDQLLPAILDNAIPGIRNLLTNQQPQIQTWPAQLSTSGFRESFFSELALPNNCGKGSLWSAAAGSFSAVGHRFLVGLLVRADQANNLGQFTIDRDPQWLDMFRIVSR